MYLGQNVCGGVGSSSPPPHSVCRIALATDQGVWVKAFVINKRRKYMALKYVVSAKALSSSDKIGLFLGISCLNPRCGQPDNLFKIGPSIPAPILSDYVQGAVAKPVGRSKLTLRVASYSNEIVNFDIQSANSI